MKRKSSIDRVSDRQIEVFVGYIRELMRSGVNPTLRRIADHACVADGTARNVLLAGARRGRIFCPPRGDAAFGYRFCGDPLTSDVES